MQLSVSGLLPTAEGRLLSQSQNYCYKLTCLPNKDGYFLQQLVQTGTPDGLSWGALGEQASVS